jgi:hypothetical protein
MCVLCWLLGLVQMLVVGKLVITFGRICSRCGFGCIWVTEKLVIISRLDGFGCTAWAVDGG